MMESLRAKDRNNNKSSVLRRRTPSIPNINLNAFLWQILQTYNFKWMK